MDELNEFEGKAVSIAERLRLALENNDQASINALEVELNEIDPTEVRKSILNQLDRLFEHPNYAHVHYFLNGDTH